jgi:hypothetical protein
MEFQCNWTGEDLQQFIIIETEKTWKIDDYLPCTILLKGNIYIILLKNGM